MSDLIDELVETVADAIGDAAAWLWRRRPRRRKRR